MPNHRITKTQFELFKREVFRWIREFGLTEYDVEVGQGEIRRHDATAQTNWSFGGKWAIVTLAHNWDHRPASPELKKVAFHEVVHLLLSPLCHEAGCRYTNADTLNEAEEGVVVRLENFYRRIIMKERP